MQSCGRCPGPGESPAKAAAREWPLPEGPDRLRAVRTRDGVSARKAPPGLHPSFKHLITRYVIPGQRARYIKKNMESLTSDYQRDHAHQHHLASCAKQPELAGR